MRLPLLGSSSNLIPSPITRAVRAYRSQRSLPLPLIQAHRGFSAIFPENTAISFSKGLEAGADGIECDLQKTRDGRFVILHDSSIDRTSNGQGRVSDLSLEELRRFDFGGGERILELSELLARVPAGNWVNLEVKGDTLNAGDVGSILAQIEKRPRAKERVMVSSFRHELLLDFKRAGIFTAALIGEEHSRGGLKGFLADMARLRPSLIHLPVQALDRVPEKALRISITGLRAFGVGVSFWTVNTEKDFLRVRDLCDFLITDEVEQALKWTGRS